jgi:hypothetical protein
MLKPLADVCLASIPLEALPALAGLRTRPEVRVVLRGGRAWVRWPVGDEEALARIVPAQGAELYAERDGAWRRVGCSLPAFDATFADGDARPLAAALTPPPPAPILCDPPNLQRIPLVLVEDEHPRPASAWCGPPAALARWADHATTRQLEALEAAWDGGRVLLLGRPPALADGERFWGRSVLAPLGRRPHPDLPEEALAEALGLKADELALLTAAGVEVVARAAFRHLSRAAARRAAAEGG